VSITISWADAGDGTGGTITVAGADPATLVTVYAQTVDASGLYTLAFAAVGTRMGSGVVPLVIAPAYRWFYADGTVSGSPARSALVYGAATDSTQSVHDRCMAAVRSRLMALTMTGTPNARVYAKESGDWKATQYPCLVLSKAGYTETQPGMTTGKDDIGYAVCVEARDAAPIDWERLGPRYTLWRQQMERALRHQRLSGVPEVIEVSIEPGPALEKRDADVAVRFVARCVSREARG
jgi:hypothetical protein